MSHDQESGPERRSEIRQRAGDRATQVGQARDVTVVGGDLVYQPATVPVPPTYIEPRRPRWRRTVALVVILVVVGSLALSVLTQPWEPPSQPETTAVPLGSLFWIGQVIVSFITILAAMAEFSGLSVRELFSTKPAGASAEAFPFHIIRDFDELLDHTLPDPMDPLLPDRSIPFIPRIASELDAAFRQHGRVLIRGRSKTGKTREAVELLRRWWYTGPTVLLAKNHVGLYPPYKVPDTLPIRNMVLFFDDVDRYCGDDDAVKRLDQTIAFFADLCHEPGELQVIATARREPEFWDKLRYDETAPPWASFELLSLSALPSDVARRLIDHLAGACGMDMDPTMADDMASKNDGTFLNLVLSLRGWLHEGVMRVGPERAAAFEGDLVTTWRRRYEGLVKVLPEAGPIYAAVDLLQRLGVPLQKVLITDLATEMSLSRASHLVNGLFHWIVWHKLDLSPWLDWYRDPRRRRRWIAVGVLVALLAFYVLSYLFLRFVPAKFQFDFFNALADELRLQLLLLSPLLPLLIPLTLWLVLRWYRRRRQRRVQSVLDRLLATEVPLRGDELRPYEGQFEGNGTSRAWPPAFFAGQDGTAAFSRLAASRLAGIYWAWAEELRVAGELGPARVLARLAGVLASAHPTPSFVLGKLWYDEGKLGRALAEFARSRTLNPSASAALALERIAWCFYQLEEFDQAETVADQALALMPTLSAARWAQGLARLQQGQVEAGLADCRQAASAKEAPPPDLAPELTTALAEASSESWADQVSRLLQRDGPPKKKHTALWRRVKWGLAVGLFLASALAFLLGVPYMIRRMDEDVSFGLQVTEVLLRLYPHAPAALTQRGVTYNKLGDYEQAIADFNEAIRLDSDYVIAYNSRGWAYSYLGDYERAIADFNRAIEIDSEHVSAYHGRGRAYNELGDHERAIADFNEAIRLDSDYVVAYNCRGWAYSYLGDYERAIADFNRAIEIDSEHVSAYHGRGRAYNELGDHERAIADYSEAIRLAPDDAWAYRDRGWIYKELGDYRRAIADWTEAIRLAPDDARLYNDRGWAYYMISDYERAITDFTEIIRLDASDTWAYFNRGDAYYKLGNYERAIADYTEAIRITPDSAWAYCKRGLLYSRLGNYERAIADFNKALEIDSEYANVYFRLGWAYCELGDYDRAIAEHTRAIELNHDPLSWPYRGRGWVYYKMGDYERATADYTEAIGLDPDYAHAYRDRGTIYKAQGDLIAVRVDWERAIELYEAQGQSDYAEQVRGWLSELGD